MPMNWTLMPVCSSLLPSFGLIVTPPLTDSPSMYNGAFSRRPLSSFISIIVLSSASSRMMSISTGVEKKYDMTPSCNGRLVFEEELCTIVKVAVVYLTITGFI